MKPTVTTLEDARARIEKLEEILGQAMSCIADAEEAYGAFDDEHWTSNEIQKRWELWRTYWDEVDFIHHNDRAAEYQSDDWEGCEVCHEHPAYRRADGRITCAEHKENP